MPLQKRDAAMLSRAVRLRWEPILRGERPMDYEAIAMALGVSDRTIRRWRKLPAWNQAVGDLDSPVGDRELVGRAKAVVEGLLADPDPRVRLGAARCLFDYFGAKHLEVQHSGEVVYMKRFDVKGVDPETLHAWVAEAVRVEGIGPGAQAALPEADPIDAEFAAADPEPAEAVV